MNHQISIFRFTLLVFIVALVSACRTASAPKGFDPSEEDTFSVHKAISALRRKGTDCQPMNYVALSPRQQIKENDMPLIEVNVFEEEITQDQTKDLIQRITNAVATVISPKMRESTWVVVHEVKSGNWGVGGNTLGVADVKRAIGGGVNNV